MPTATTRKTESTALIPILYLAFELSLDQWKLAFATEMGRWCMNRGPKVINSGPIGEAWGCWATLPA